MTYDADCNRLTLDAGTAFSGSDASSYFNNAYVYDALNRVSQITQGSLGSDTDPYKEIDFTYTADSQFHAISSYDENALDLADPLLTASYGYDHANQLTSIGYSSDWFTSPGSFSWTYDIAGRVASSSGGRKAGRVRY